MHVEKREKKIGILYHMGVKRLGSKPQHVFFPIDSLMIVSFVLKQISMSTLFHGLKSSSDTVTLFALEPDCAFILSNECK